MEVRQNVLKSLETARRDKFIGAPLEARVHLGANGEFYPLLEQYARELPALFIVSQVSLDRGQEAKELSVRVERAAGSKCERCWKYTTDVGSHASFPTICAACAGAVEEIMHG
jgi:isoleucyl-tRNA synthetase